MSTFDSRVANDQPVSNLVYTDIRGASPPFVKCSAPSPHLEGVLGGLAGEELRGVRLQPPEVVLHIALHVPQRLAIHRP